MTSRRTSVSHVLDGGWATDFGTTADATIQRGGRLAIPFLRTAENMLFTLRGGFEKAEGTAAINSAALESGADIRGFFDFWIAGTTGAPAQHRIIHLSTVVKKDDGDGTFADIKTGLEDDKIPAYAVLNDLLIYTSDSNTDVPQSWDGTTNQNLAGTPPNFAFHVEHKGRIWAGGIAANPSRLAYSALNNPEDWTGAGSGTIDISTDDGDRVVGLASHNGELIVFKGPYIGSIHRIQGSSPTGSDPFRRTTLAEGVPCSAHNTIVKAPPNDLLFVAADASIRSLAATAKFGDYDGASPSFPINQWLRDNINFSELKRGWAITAPSGDYTLFTFTLKGKSINTALLMVDHRFKEPRWSYWTSYKAGCLGVSINSSNSNQPTLVMGGNDGILYNMQQVKRSISTAGSIDLRMRTPSLDYGDPFRTKTACGVGIQITPTSDSNLVFRWARDGNSEQSVNLSQAGSSAVLGSFILGTDTLGGDASSYTFDEMEEGGEFRSIYYRMTNTAESDNVKFHSFAISMEANALSTEIL